MNKYEYSGSKRVFRGRKEISPKDFSCLTEREVSALIDKKVIKKIKDNVIDKDTTKKRESTSRSKTENK